MVSCVSTDTGAVPSQIYSARSQQALYLFIYLLKISGLLQRVKSFRYFCGLEEELRVNTVEALKGTTAGALLLLMQGSTSLVNRVALLLKVLIAARGQCSSTL